MKAKVSKSTEVALEKAANQSGMFLDEFVTLVLENLVVNPSHMDVYKKIAEHRIAERTRQAQEFLNKKYSKK